MVGRNLILATSFTHTLVKLINGTRVKMAVTTSVDKLKTTCSFVGFFDQKTSGEKNLPTQRNKFYTAAT